MIRRTKSRFNGWCRICSARHSEGDWIALHTDPTGDLGALCRVCANLVSRIHQVDLCAPNGVLP